MARTKTRAPSAAGVAMLDNLAAGRGPFAGLEGRSAHGGATRTLAALRRHGWIDAQGVTADGMAALARFKEGLPAVQGIEAEGQASPPVPMKAWRICVPAWQPTPLALTMATTRASAIARNLASARDAGYRIAWGDIRATRASELDAAFERHGAFSWDYDHAMRMLSAVDEQHQSVGRGQR